MPIYLAAKTYAAINAAIEKDQGGAFRQWLGKVIPHMSDAYAGESDPFRSHLGASIIGQECARKVAYDWHWTTRPKFSGRLLRLFNRGHLEEARFIAMLLTIGATVYQHDTNGKQFRISDCAGHMGGSGDGVVIGLPDLQPGQAALLEFKTHSEKSFLSVQKDGVQKSKPEHYVQMNQYMGRMGLAVALYGAVNKNTDEIYLELVPFDKANFEQYSERAHKIVWMDSLPTRISDSPGWFSCKWCDHNKVCHGLGGVPDRNCRTCRNARPIDDGQNGGAWRCGLHGVTIDKATQIVGCDKYERGEI